MEDPFVFGQSVHVPYWISRVGWDRKANPNMYMLKNKGGRDGVEVLSKKSSGRAEM
jgi:hypothetical protein